MIDLLVMVALMVLCLSFRSLLTWAANEATVLRLKRNILEVKAILRSGVPREWIIKVSDLEVEIMTSKANVALLATTHGHLWATVHEAGEVLKRLDYAIAQAAVEAELKGVRA